MRALIAVAGQSLPAGDVRSWKADSVAIPGPYIRALHRAGGQEAVLGPRRIDGPKTDEVLDRFQGLLLIGGGDIDPAHYGEDPVPECYGVDSEADLFEMRLVRGAIERGLPVLAICRGFQIVNVATGGSLDQHITGRRGLVGHGIPGERSETHEVRVETGRAPDGIVEAMEHPEGSWVVAVQWHPERTAETDPAQQGLFDALVEHAAGA
jgi:putative glutamine amidotransferase